MNFLVHGIKGMLSTKHPMVATRMHEGGAYFINQGWMLYHIGKS